MHPSKGLTQEDVLAGMTTTDLRNLHEVAQREAYNAVLTLQKIRLEMRKRVGCLDDLPPPPPKEESGCDVSTISRFELDVIDSDVENLFGES
jgi:hypothetical protein